VDTTPKFYFSLRSPYSWLALHDLKQAHVPDLRWHPFWEPDEQSTAMLTEVGETFPYTPMSRAKHLYVLQDVARLATARDLRITWPVDIAPVWEVPHLGYLVAERDGLGAEYVELVCQARWQQGRDICDRATVAQIAAELGLDPVEVASAADSAELRRAGLTELVRVCREQVFGVPYFRRGRQRYWGLDRLPDFLAAVETEQQLTPAGVATARFDEGHAGGCG
jgi:2-hydroxychromene-2-carboxylate isomerase